MSSRDSSLLTSLCFYDEQLNECSHVALVCWDDLCDAAAVKVAISHTRTGTQIHTIYPRIPVRPYTYSHKKNNNSLEARQEGTKDPSVTNVMYINHKQQIHAQQYSSSTPSASDTNSNSM